MLDSTATFKQFEPMVEGAAWKAHKQYGLEHDDAKGMAYEIFCTTLRRHDPERASFSTYLYGSLDRRLKNYAMRYLQKHNRKQLPRIDNIDDMQITDYRYSLFSTTMDKLEESLGLSDDAQEIIDFIISREWEIPGCGMNRVPRISYTVTWFRAHGWKVERVKKAWQEIKAWWQTGEINKHAFS